ncbi:MAG TPA: hypothetical protein VH207_05135 [Chthoniobacterales bacterium]|jgi:YD repeat-containing protein|nr:hypothetical protein [Chthoniobacterales bacterium]
MKAATRPDGFRAGRELRFKTVYRFDAAGRLTEKQHLGNDGTLQNKLVYSCDAAGHQTGYAVYDGAGKLIGHTTPKKPTRIDRGARERPSVNNALSSHVLGIFAR